MARQSTATFQKMPPETARCFQNLLHYSSVSYCLTTVCGREMTYWCNMNILRSFCNTWLAAPLYKGRGSMQQYKHFCKHLNSIWKYLGNYFWNIFSIPIHSGIWHHKNHTSKTIRYPVSYEKMNVKQWNKGRYRPIYGPREELRQPENKGQKEFIQVSQNYSSVLYSSHEI